MYELVWSARFTRQLRRFKRSHPELDQRIAGVLRDLETDPYQPHLKLHRLQGGMNDLHAISVTYSHRIILTLLVSECEITLLDIGTHDEVYR